MGRCTCISASFLETYDVFRRETPTIWAWGKDVKPRIWAPGGLPAKIDQGRIRGLWALRGPNFSLRNRKFQHFQNFVEMVGSPERKRTKQGESDGRYKDGGLGGDNLYYLCCSICSIKVAACKFQSRSQDIKSQEASQLHQRAALKWQEIQEQEGCVARLPGCSCTAHSSAPCRARQTASLKTRTLSLRTYQCWYMLYFLL